LAVSGWTGPVNLNRTAVVRPEQSGKKPWSQFWLI
jgi:hypothetical protein